MKITVSMYQKALEYASRGYSIMPLKKDKTPYLITWKQYQTTPATDEEIEKWWSTFPNANIGIITGKVSGITVIDVDTYKGGDPSIFPETYTVRTGNGGLQLYYKYSPGFTISADSYKDMPGIDMRSDGGYVVAAPSKTDYIKNGKKMGGQYSIEKNIPYGTFPSHLFKDKKKKKTFLTTTEVSSGSRNDSLASFTGRLLQVAKESDWETEVYPAVLRANKTYKPPMPDSEVRSTFVSIAKKEKDRRESLIKSPIQIGENEVINISIRKNQNGVPYKDMANVLAVLSQHPYYKDSLKFNEFKQEIEYDGRALEEADLVKAQYFMQTEASLNNISKEAVYAAIQHYANKNKYDEARDWVTSVQWDRESRLSSWIARATSLQNDPYLEAIGMHWFCGMVSRIVNPGSIFDYVLVLVGPQGIGKTSFFRIIGGPWYKSYTGAMDNKDFYLALRGAIIMDLDEGAALYKAEAIKIKSIITEICDEYRAPYDRVTKKYPRRFVFSMSTNNTEPFHDVTGNRRYWTIDTKSQIDFKWLEENRDQLFAEAYHYIINKLPLPEVPRHIADEQQELHLADDSWTGNIVQFLKRDPEYREGSEQFETTIAEVFIGTFDKESLARITRAQEMRIGTILRKNGGLEKKRVMRDSERKVIWVLTPEKAKELQEKNPKDPDWEFNEYGK